MAHSIETPYAVITKEAADSNLWGTLNALGSLDWYRHDSHVLEAGGLTLTGEPFVCADGKLRLTAAVDGEGMSWYLVEDIHNYAS